VSFIRADYGQCTALSEIERPLTAEIPAPVKACMKLLDKVSDISQQLDPGSRPIVDHEDRSESPFTELIFVRSCPTRLLVGLSADCCCPSLVVFDRVLGGVACTGLAG
jgi:hypothetical protein